LGSCPVYFFDDDRFNNGDKLNEFMAELAGKYEVLKVVTSKEFQKKIDEDILTN
jgi:hypothetical protein